MNKLLKRIILFSAIFIGIIVVLGIVLPNTYSVKHSMVIHAPIEKVRTLTHDHGLRVPKPKTLLYKTLRN